MNSIILLAALLTLQPGYNNPGAAGEVVAIEAATTNATATIAIKSVQSVTAYSNITAQVINFETAYAITYTNYDGNAAIKTNVIGYVNYADFKTTNGVNKIVSGPTRFDMPITNTVITATVPVATYAKTNDLATVTTSAHFGNVTTNAFLFGDGILVTGAAEGDSIKVLLK